VKIIVAGSREFQTEFVVKTTLTEFFSNWHRAEIVSGLAKGPDLWGKEWAELGGWPVKEFPADWKTHGKAAGAIRNEQMGNYADALIAFWDGNSRGTKHMIDYMLKLGKEVHVYQTPR
jgi:hypothetical protein